MQQAVQWQSLFDDGCALIGKGDFAAALLVLVKALAVMEELDAAEVKAPDRNFPDRRVADTLERIAYAYQAQGLLAEAEPLYRRALEIGNNYMLGFFVRQAASQNLAKLLLATDRADEAQLLLARYPLQAAQAPLQIASMALIEMGLLRTLSVMGKMAAGASPETITIVGELLEHVETCYGTASSQYAEAAEKVGCLYTTMNMANARMLFEKAILARLSVGSKDQDMRALAGNFAMCDRSCALSQALLTKYSGGQLNHDHPITLANSIRMKIAAAKGEDPPAMVDPASTLSSGEAEKVIADWRQARSSEIKAAASLTREQKLKRLHPLVERALALAQESEAGASHPLSTICILSEKSKLYEELGDIDQAIKCLEQKMQIIASHWGESHELMVGTHMTHSKLLQKK